MRLAPSLFLLSAFVLSGCYTQLAAVDEPVRERSTRVVERDRDARVYADPSDGRIYEDEVYYADEDDYYREGYRDGFADGRYGYARHFNRFYGDPFFYGTAGLGCYFDCWSIGIGFGHGWGYTAFGLGHGWGFGPGWGWPHYAGFGYAPVFYTPFGFRNRYYAFNPYWGGGRWGHGYYAYDSPYAGHTHRGYGPRGETTGRGIHTNHHPIRTVTTGRSADPIGAPSLRTGGTGSDRAAARATRGESARGAATTRSAPRSVRESATRGTTTRPTSRGTVRSDGRSTPSTRSTPARTPATRSAPTRTPQTRSTPPAPSTRSTPPRGSSTRSTPSRAPATRSTPSRAPSTRSTPSRSSEGRSSGRSSSRGGRGGGS
jgi:hypothetical protein